MISLTLSHIDKHDIIKALAGGTPETVKKWLEAAPGCFIPSVGLKGNPITPKVNRVRVLLENDKIKAVGEILTQYQRIAPNDTRLDPHYALAEE